MTGALRGEQAVVVGLGASGKAAVGALLAEGAVVRVTESRTMEQLALSQPDGRADPEEDALAGLEGVPILAGGHRPEHLDGATVVVVSPGVLPSAPVIAWAEDRDLEVWSELELGARLCSVPVVAVTGTNGKSTTVEMVAAAMRASGLRARACGNVGYPFSRAAEEPFDALAVEASSFQLRFVWTFRPRVSALLNLAPDHLDWHGSFSAYAASKARIYQVQGDRDVHIGRADDPEAARLSRAAPCPVRWFRWGPPGQGETGVVDEQVVTRIDDAGVLGTHPGAGRAFLLDAAAAGAAALSFGLPAELVREALSAFAPLPHRGTVVAEIGTVRFVEDSKATNPHATLAALEDLRGAVLIAGGLAKGVDLSPLRAAAPSLAAVVAIGEAAPAIAAAFRGLVPVTAAASIEEAAEAAFELAPPGGTVILAPACASQDMFRDYRERGDRFADAARSLAERRAPDAGRRSRAR